MAGQWKKLLNFRGPTPTLSKMTTEILMIKVKKAAAEARNAAKELESILLRITDLY